MEPIKEELEFLTGIKYSGKEYVGIVVNQDNQILTFYDVDTIPNLTLRKEFLELGQIWWWESNRQLPIDVFLHYEMKQFHSCLKTFATKFLYFFFTLSNLKAPFNTNLALFFVLSSKSSKT